MSEHLKQGTVVRWGDLEKQPHGEPYSPPIKAGMGTVVESGCGGSLVHVINSITQRFIYEEHLVFVAESIDRLASRVSDLEGERDAAVQDNAAMLAALKWMNSPETDWEDGAIGVGYRFRDKATEVLDSGPHPGAAILSRLESAERAAEKLPLTQDGVRAWPGMTLYRPVPKPCGHVEVRAYRGGHTIEQWRCGKEFNARRYGHSDGWLVEVNKCYSTEAAALSAHREHDKGAE